MTLEDLLLPLVFSDPLTPLIVLCDYILIGNSYAHETTMQPCRTFWEEGFVGRLRVHQEHAENMRAALSKCNPDLMKKHPDYVCRIVSDEGDIGKGHLGRFKDVETISPVIVTTSQMLTTGVDVPTCKNVAIIRNIGSMTEFKQIIGRGTRVRDDYGKLYFNILDYTGAATRLFADSDFDGDPISVKEGQNR
jgi:type I restriction enzyme R subunit